jgi:hypothetical protein
MTKSQAWNAVHPALAKSTTEMRLQTAGMQNET